MFSPKSGSQSAHGFKSISAISLDVVPSKGGDWHRLLLAGTSVCPPSSAWRKDSKSSLSWSQEAGRVDGVKAGGRVALPS